MTTRLEKIYKDTVVPKLMKDFGYTNPMQVPKITKITLNMGVGEAVGNKKILENAVADLATITGQKPVTTKARVSRPSHSTVSPRWITCFWMNTLSRHSSTQVCTCSVSP